MKEHRGWGFSSGGESSAVTIATFLRSYNPALVGEAMGIRDVPQQIGKAASVCEPKDYAICGLNAAVDGARVGWLSAQVDWLESRLNELRPGTWKRDWKLLTVLTGLDDIVFGPQDFNNETKNTTVIPTDVAVVERELDALMASLHARFPNLLVNVLALPEDFEVKATVQGSCRIAKYVTERFGVKWTDLNLWHKRIFEYNEALVRVVTRWQHKACTSQECSMLVALRVVLRKASITASELDPVDCFHPNMRLSEAMAIGVWNEMLLGTASSRKGAWGLQWTEKATCLQSNQRFTAPDPGARGPWHSQLANGILV